MAFFKYIFLIFFFCGTAVFSQNVIKHKVKSGESIYSLAKKYDVKVADIYELNPSLKGSVLGLNAVVSIPNSKSVKEEKPSKIEKATIAVETKKEATNTTNQSVLSHLVKQKETLYSISKKYGVTMESICEMNPELKTANLKVGALLIVTNPNYIPQAKEEVKTEVKTEPTAIAIVTKTESSVTADVTHKVQPKETLFKISKKYDVTIAELQKLNPNMPSGLPVGYNLIVKTGLEVSKIVTTTTSEKPVKDSDDSKALALMYSSKANYLIAKASENLGTPYRSGGITNAGFDCSGLMFSTFKNIDMILPRSSYEMASYGKKVDKSTAQKGDLIFFATFGGKRVSHVGMITEILDDEIKFIHSSTQSGVIISSTKEDYYAKNFVQINRVLSE
jgi:cell wall-associated NlpC family hydrolase